MPEKTVMEVHITSLETFKNLVISKKIDKDVKKVMVDNIEGCIDDAKAYLIPEKDQMNLLKWISMEDATPTEEQFGEQFICCVKTATGTRYCMTEWFNPFLEGEEIVYDKEIGPEFLFERQSFKEEVIAWAPFNRYDFSI